ncbi:MAG: class I SAM-dependent methyltransferase [Gemmatimonadales bacterium]|nr:class I SAM-dependent methyltransferase [Gemmatimonadales bacterium]
MTSTDHFSRDASAYAKFRPRYPDALFGWLAGLVEFAGTAWDCATGNGQAATMLTPYFQRVVASDLSRTQVKAARRGERLHYIVSSGEAVPLADRSVDLVTVAQAFHWLDHSRFYEEVDRVARPGAAFAVWCYGRLYASPEIDRALEQFYDGTVGPYWPPERQHVERAYRHFDIPIDERAAPPLTITLTVTLPELLGYVGTWSAVGRYIAANGRDPVPAFGEELGRIWGPANAARQVHWPLSIRAGRWLGARPPSA